MKKYGSLIAKLRKKNNLTQAQLGEKLNISYQAVSKWENNLSEPDLVTIEKLADVFNITVSEFFDMPNNLDKIDSKSNISNNKFNAKSKFKFIKSKPWYLVAGLGCIILLLSLIVALVPIKYSSSKIYKMVDPSVFCITLETSSGKQAGSGFFINDKGLAVTNYHVIEGATSGQIQLNNGKKYSIKKVVGCDENLDIAIIQIDIKKSKPVKLGNSNKVKVGETVYAIGYPEPFELGSVDSTLTQGIISKKSYTIDGNTYIQTTANITHGNSGGVLVNQSGKVIGIMTLMAGDVDYMNMAIPINKIKSVKRNLNLTLAELTERNKDHTLTYMSDGVSVGNVTVSYNKRTEPKTISKSGYIFDGWYTDISYTKLFDFNQSIIANTTVYAKWTPIKYTIRFDANGGTGAMPDIQCTYDHIYSLPISNFINQEEWLVQNYWIINTKTYSLNAQVSNLTTLNNDIVICRPKWDYRKYTITYQSNNNLAEFKTPSKTEYNYYEAFKLEQPTSTHYNFIGWTGEGITTPQLTVWVGGRAYGNKTYVANWEPKVYKIYYDLNGGEKGDGEYITTYTYETPTFDLPTPVREGYKFLYWTYRISSNGYVICNSVKQFTGVTRTFIANWELVEYKISYSSNNDNVVPVLKNAKYKYNPLDEEFNLPEVSADHYEFMGWTSKDILTPQLTVTIESGTTGDLHFVSNWKPITYTITYNDMEGFEKDDTYIAEYTYDMETYTLPTLERDDAGFYGWQVEGGGVITSIPTKPYENLVLTPSWGEKYYFVNYKDKRGKVLKTYKVMTSNFPYTITNYQPLGCYYFDNNLYSNIDCTELILSENNLTYTLSTPMNFDVYLNAYYTKDDFTYYSNDIVDRYIGIDKNVYIPSNVTELYTSTFFYNTNIENVYMSDSVTKLGLQAFMGSSVKYVKLSNNLISIGDKCFYKCTNLESIVLPDSLEEIGYYVFYDCIALKEINIPNKVTVLDQTFYNCISLRKVTLSDNLKVLGYAGRGGVFEYCSSLEEIVIPEKVEEMAYRSFYGCASLKTVIMKSNLITTIRNYNFKNCTNLTTLVLGSGIQIIGEEVFEGCDSLENIYYNGTQEQFEAIEFECDINARVYYFASEKPEDAGNYWYYDNDGNVAVW